MTLELSSDWDFVLAIVIRRRYWRTSKLVVAFGSAARAGMMQGCSRLDQISNVSDAFSLANCRRWSRIICGPLPVAVPVAEVVGLSPCYAI